MREQIKAKLHLSERTALVLDPEEPFPALLRLQHEQTLKTNEEPGKETASKAIFSKL